MTTTTVPTPLTDLAHTLPATLAEYRAHEVTGPQSTRPTAKGSARRKAKRKNKNSNPFKVSPWQSVPVLVRMLARAEWGPMAGPQLRGVRATLRALADALADLKADYKGYGIVTAQQVANRSGYTIRWTRECLQFLEDAGLLQWERGGVIDGEPRPGYMRIVKAHLAEFVNLARPLHDEADKRRRDETTRRLRRLWSRRVPGKRSSRSDHAEVTAALPPLRGRGEGATRPIPTHNPTNTVHQSTTPATTEDEPSAYARYMATNYPDLHPRQWTKVVQTDPLACALLHE